jgi:hypothetical protein
VKDLRQLDDRFVPALAARVGVWRAAWAARRLKPVSTPKVRSLRQLDERFAGTGPLAVFRDVPQLGFVVIGLVFLAATGTAVSREAAQNRLAQQQAVVDPGAGTGPILPGSEGEVSSTLGPAVGDTVPAYVALAKQGLVAVQKSKDGRLALVSFRAYLTPAQLTVLFGGAKVVRVYLRSRQGGKDAAQLPVDVSGDLAYTLGKAYAQAAHGRLLAQRAYQRYVDTLTVATKEDKAFKDLYATFAASTGREAKDYQRSCACVYAAVVSGSPSVLSGLAAKAAVRAVQTGPAGVALTSLEVLPLLPEVTGVVPAAQAPVEAP